MITVTTLTAATRRTTWSLSYTSISLVLIVDQLLLPMFHFGSAPYKISYFLLIFWLISWMSNYSYIDIGRNDILRVFGAFAIILYCILLGEFLLVASYEITSYYEALRNFLTFLFSALAFGLGRSSKHFQLKWLLYILFTAVILNFVFIIFKNELPSWLINFYYSEKATSDMEGFQTVEEIIELVRPRGVFGNPNASMLMVNIIVLVICIALRKKVMVIRSLAPAVALIILPVLLAAVLASRAEFFVACLLGYLNYQNLRSLHVDSLRKILIATFISFFLVGALFLDGLGEGVISNVERAISVSQVLDDKIGANENISRPLNNLTVFIDRFMRSPLFGYGVSQPEVPGFEQSTQNYHNDIFYILSTSGVLGFFSLGWLLSHLVSRLGWLVLVPFILPGLVNTFVLTVPAFIAYFGMIGVLFAKVNSKPTPRDGLHNPRQIAS